MLKISVAMTTYNGERYVRQQLQSLLDQIRLPDEVVITDDGSADDTVRIVRDFIEENGLDWKLVENGETLGFIRNFRKALSLTSGDVVFLCDQDDVWYEDKIESFAGTFAANSQVLAIGSSFAVINGENDTSSAAGERGKNNYGLISQRLKNPLEHISLRGVMHSNISPGCTSAYRREIVDYYVENTECILPHDHELNLIAAAHGGLYFYNLPLIRYRLHDENTLGFAKKEQSRTEIATEKAAAAKAIRGLPNGERLYALCTERLAALQAKKLTAVLKLFRYKEYYRYYSLREQIGDLLFVLKG